MCRSWYLQAWPLISGLSMMPVAALHLWIVWWLCTIRQWSYRIWLQGCSCRCVFMFSMFNFVSIDGIDCKPCMVGLQCEHALVSCMYSFWPVQAMCAFPRLAPFGSLSALFETVFVSMSCRALPSLVCSYLLIPFKMRLKWRYLSNLSNLWVSLW